MFYKSSTFTLRSYTNGAYPFGSLVPNRHGSSPAYRYGFNGKEKDDEIIGEGNFEDYGMRCYNPRIGRFFSVDPLSKKYPELTPYQFASNTPIQAVDLDGLEAWVVVWASQSKGPDGKSVVGHAGILVQNYKKVTYEINTADMRVVTQTAYVPDGTYTYFDLWPADRAPMMDPNLKLNAAYAQKDFKMINTSDQSVFMDASVMEKWISNNDISGGEHCPPDGVLKISLTAEQTMLLKEQAILTESFSAQYSPKDNNCSTFVCNTLKSVGIDIPKEENYTLVASFIVGGNASNEFHTPNNTYNQLLKNQSVNIIKDAGNKTSEDYEDAIVDPGIDTYVQERKKKL